MTRLRGHAEVIAAAVATAATIERTAALHEVQAIPLRMC